MCSPVLLARLKHRCVFFRCSSPKVHGWTDRRVGGILIFLAQVARYPKIPSAARRWMITPFSLHPHPSISTTQLLPLTTPSSISCPSQLNRCHDEDLRVFTTVASRLVSASRPGECLSWAGDGFRSRSARGLWNVCHERPWGVEFKPTRVERSTWRGGVIHEPLCVSYLRDD